MSGLCARCGALSHAVIDLETTALVPARDAVVEVGVVLAHAPRAASAAEAAALVWRRLLDRARLRRVHLRLPNDHPSVATR